MEGRLKEKIINWLQKLIGKRVTVHQTVVIHLRENQDLFEVFNDFNKSYLKINSMLLLDGFSYRGKTPLVINYEIEILK